MEAFNKILRTPSAFVLLLVAVVSLIGVIIKSETDKAIARIPIDATSTAEARLTESARFGNMTQSPIFPSATQISSPTVTETLAVTFMGTATSTYTFQPTNTLPPPSTCIAWEFSKDGDSQGWNVGQGITLEVYEGYMMGEIAQPQNFWVGPDNLAIDSTLYKSLEIRYRIASRESSDVAYFYWTKADDPQFGNSKRIKFDAETNNTWHDLSIYLESNINWNGIITGIRLYPTWFSDARTLVQYDYIRLCH